MATVPTQIANLALAHLAVGEEISNLDTDRTQPATTCRRFYQQVLEECLRDGLWPFATRRVSLAVLEEQPTPAWGYAYRVPSDCLRIHHLVHPGLRTPARDQRIVFQVERDAEGLRLLTDWPDAELVYTQRLTDLAFVPPDFLQAMACLLAYYVAPKLTAGDQFRLGERALATYRWRIGMAQATAANEEQPDVEPESELIRARD